MYDQTNRLPKNLIYPPYYKRKYKNYFWDRFESKFKKAIVRLRKEDLSNPKIISTTLDSKRDLLLDDVRIAGYLGRIFNVQPMIKFDYNEDGFIVITLFIVGTQESVKLYKWLMGFVISHRLNATLQLRKQLLWWKTSLKNREPWKIHKVPHVSSIASQLNKYEYRYFKNWFKNILENASRDRQYAQKKRVKKKIKKYIEDRRIKYQILNRKNYEQIRQDIGSDQIIK